MSNEITNAEKSLSKVVVDEKMIRDYLFTSETELTEKQQNMFMQIAVRHNLDPFKHEIYPIAYGKEFSIVTGYQVYIERAETSGKLNGWACENTESGAKITIYRKDWDQAFDWEVSYQDFDKGHGSWKTMRQFMVKKVCIGQGFRLAFPAELGSMPYLKEEMEGARSFNSNATPQPQVKKAQAKTKAQTLKTRGLVTDISSKKTKTNPIYIIRTKDAQFTTFDEKFATLAKSSMAVEEGGAFITEAFEVEITYEDNDYKTIKEIDLVEE